MTNTTAIHEDLLERVARIAGRVRLPAIRSFELAPAHVGGTKCNHFAALLLADGTVGITYVALDDAVAGLHRHLPSLSLPGRSPAELASLFAEPEGWQRSLGLAAVNAISQVVLADHPALSPMPSSLPVLDLVEGDRLGMVGYFTRLVDQVRALGIPLNVIERDARFLGHADGVEVSLDVSRLRGCNKVIVTGTTLLNHSLDEVLEQCTAAEHILLLGPSASCLPEPLFARGVTVVGGFQVTSPARFRTLWAGSEGWREAGLRYCIRRETYRSQGGKG